MMSERKQTWAIVSILVLGMLVASAVVEIIASNGILMGIAIFVIVLLLARLFVRWINS